MSVPPARLTGNGSIVLQVEGKLGWGVFVWVYPVAFEHLDMMLMSLLASSIVKEFVKSPTPGMELIYAYIGYAIAFIVRPLGAFAFGCIGDLYGRKISFS